MTNILRLLFWSHTQMCPGLTLASAFWDESPGGLRIPYSVSGNNRVHHMQGKMPYPLHDCSSPCSKTSDNSHSSLLLLSSLASLPMSKNVLVFSFLLHTILLYSIKIFLLGWSDSTVGGRLPCILPSP